MRLLPAFLLACLLTGPALADPAEPPPRTRLFGFADAQGRTVLEPVYFSVMTAPSGDWAAISSRDKAGFVNLRTGAATGLVFDPFALDFLRTPLFADGPEPVGQGGKRGYADEQGRMVLPAIYDIAGRFGPDGLAVVVLDGKRGFIDRQGRFLLPGDYDQIRDFRNGLAVVQKNGKFGAIDREGKLVIPLLFGFLGDFAPSGLAIATRDNWPVREGSRFGFVDRSGRFVIPPLYAAVSVFSDSQGEEDREAPPGLARVTTYESDGSHRTGYIDASGNMVAMLPPGLNGMHVARNGLIQVQDVKTAKWGFADSSGRIVIPVTFEGASGFGPNGLAAARANGKWGYIGTDGRFAIEPAFDSAGMFDAEGRAQVWQGSLSRLIDSSGKVLVSFPIRILPLSLAPAGFAVIEYFPPKYDYPVRRFGRWTLERTLEAVPEIPSMGPSVDARIRLTMRSDDGLVAWTAETEGWLLTLKTEINPGGSADRTDYSEIDVLPFGAVGLLDYFRRHLRGEFESAISFSSADPKALAEQSERLRTVAARRGDYLRQLDESRPDLESAWTAMQEDIAAQFGKLSGRPCGVTECVY